MVLPERDKIKLFEYSTVECDNDFLTILEPGFCYYINFSAICLNNIFAVQTCIYFDLKPILATASLVWIQYQVQNQFED